GVARERQENDSREELREANEAEVERAPGDLVHLPADCNRLHLRCEDDAESRRLVKHEGRVRECDALGGPGSPGSGGHRTSTGPQNQGSDENGSSSAETDFAPDNEGPYFAVVAPRMPSKTIPSRYWISCSAIPV